MTSHILASDSILKEGSEAETVCGKNMSELKILQPKFGEPCNGCGECCVQYPCGLARLLLGCEAGPCQALEKHDGIFRCGLILRPLHYLPHHADEAPFAAEALSYTFKSLLGVGRGCCSSHPEVVEFARKNKRQV